MKTLFYSSFLLLNFLFVSQPSWSQAKIGVALGGTLSRTAIDSDHKQFYKDYQDLEIRDGYRRTGWSAGMFVQMPMGKGIYGEAGFSFVNRGFKIRKEGDNPFDLKESSLYLELPVQLKKEFRNFFVQAGLKPSYWLSRKYVITDYFPEPMENWGFNQGDAQLRRPNLGYNVGIGYKLPFYEGIALSLEYTRLGMQEREGNVPLMLRESSYFSLTARMDLANTNQLVRDSLGIYFQGRVGTDIQIGYAAQLDGNSFEQIIPISPTVGILVGKAFGKWEVETGVLYTQRKKLFGGHLLIDGPDWPFRALLQSGMQLRTDIIEVPLKGNYHLNSGFYATASLSPQFVLSQRVDIYNRESREDRHYSYQDRKQLWSISCGAGYKLPDLAGHPLFIEATLQRGLRTISSYRNQALAYVPLVASISLDVEL